MYKPDFIKKLDDLKAEIDSPEGIHLSCVIRVEYNEKTESYIFSIGSQLRNDSEKELTSITFQIDFLADDVLLHSDREFWYGVDHALGKGMSEAYQSGFQTRMDKAPEKIGLSVTETKDVSELPLYHLPLPGEYLYQAINDDHINHIDEQLPSAVIVQRGSVAGIRSDRIEDPEQIRQLVGSFCRMQIVGRVYQMVTDNDNGLFFEFPDGYKYGVRFNMDNLELYVHRRYYLYAVKSDRIF
ncbi:MAG: hypothetical protein J6Z03_09515 [Erysipelotrichaceae bacterium]|nr:hypothetical protein [Erysipelotrichaceae bacterium]